MTRLANGFETGPAGTNFTVANSDDVGGNAASVVSVGASNTITYQTASAVFGTFGLLFTQGGTAASLIQFTDPAPATSFSARMYFNLTGAPTDAMQWGIQVRSSTDTYITRAVVATGSVLKLYNTAGSTIATGTVALSNNTWYRLEFRGSGLNGSTGTLTVAVYTGDVEGALVDTLTVNNVTTTGIAERIRYGKIATGTITNFSIDEVVQDIGTDVAIGGVSASTPATVTPATVAAGSTVETPTGQAGSTATPAAFTAVATVPTLTAQVSSQVSTDVVPLTTAVPTPSVITGGSSSVQTTRVLATTSVPAPTVRVERRIIPATVALPAAIVRTPAVLLGLATPVFSEWNGTSEVVLTIEGVWDGTSVTPAASVEVLD